MADTAPTPDIATLTRFLLTCPMLRRLTGAQVEPLAKHLRMRHYASSSYLFRDEVPSRDTPLRAVVHGHASWETDCALLQKGAWMQQPGSLMGVSAVNDWAYHAGIEGTHPREGLPKILSKTAGDLWVLELPPDRLDDVFGDPAADALLVTLLSMVPTIVNAPEVVTAMRENTQFSQMSTHALHRLLEYAPTLHYAAHKDDNGESKAEQGNQGPKQQGMAQQAQFIAPKKGEIEDEIEAESPPPGAGKIADGPAIYYVLEGELLVFINEETIALRAGELGGPELFPSTGTLSHTGARTTSSAQAVVITHEAVLEMMRATPGFARKLGPRRHGKRVSP